MKQTSWVLDRFREDQVFKWGTITAAVLLWVAVAWADALFLLLVPPIAAWLAWRELKSSTGEVANSAEEFEDWF